VAPPPAPSFLREGEIRTSLGPDAVVSGRLSFTTPTRIEGKLRGELRCTRALVVAPRALVEGRVQAETIVVEGTLRGEVLQAERVEVRPGGRLLGRVRTGCLVVHDGAIFEGDCQMEADAARAPEVGGASG
jgi:cytoskeletal protein CcmA (bactofilin family)